MLNPTQSIQGQEKCLVSTLYKKLIVLIQNRHVRDDCQWPISVNYLRNWLLLCFGSESCELGSFSVQYRKAWRTLTQIFLLRRWSATLLTLRDTVVRMTFVAGNWETGSETWEYMWCLKGLSNPLLSLIFISAAFPILWSGTHSTVDKLL